MQLSVKNDIIKKISWLVSISNVIQNKARALQTSRLCLEKLKFYPVKPYSFAFKFSWIDFVILLLHFWERYRLNHSKLYQKFDHLPDNYFMQYVKYDLRSYI